MGSSAIAMASSSARFWPYASDEAGAPARSASPTCSSSSMARSLNVGHAGDRAPPLLAHAGRAGEGELEVLAQRHRLEEARDLEGARDAERCDLLGGPAGDVLAVEQDGAGRRREEAGEQVEERGLARSVGSDEGVDRAAGDRQVDLRDGAETAELLGQGPGLEQRGTRQDLHLLVRRARVSGCRAVPVGVTSGDDSGKSGKLRQSLGGRPAERTVGTHTPDAVLWARTHEPAADRAAPVRSRGLDRCDRSAEAVPVGPQRYPRKVRKLGKPEGSPRDDGGLTGSGGRRT